MNHALNRDDGSFLSQEYLHLVRRSHPTLSLQGLPTSEIQNTPDEDTRVES